MLAVELCWDPQRVCVGGSIKSQLWSATQASGYGEISRYQGEMLRKSAEEAPEVPNYRVCRTTELQKCISAESKCVCCCCCCFSLIHEKKNITALVQLVLQELVPGPFSPVAARLALSSNGSSGSSSSAGSGGQGALSSSRELCPSRSGRNVSIGEISSPTQGKGLQAV